MILTYEPTSNADDPRTVTLPCGHRAVVLSEWGSVRLRLGCPTCHKHWDGISLEPGQ